MGKYLKIFIIILACFFISPLALAEDFSVEESFTELFDQHGAVILLTDPISGEIVYANNAAGDFYGYSKAELENMNIKQINSLGANEARKEMNLAKEEDRNYFKFIHRLASGENLNVELFSYPVNLGGRELLFTIVYDATIKAILEEKEERIATLFEVFVILAATIFLMLLFILISNYRRLKISNSELENAADLRRTFFDADNSMTYLKDENFKYVFVNKAYADYLSMTAQEIIGLDDYDLYQEESAAERRKLDLAVLEKQEIIEEEIERYSKAYSITSFPVKMLNGKNGVGAYIKDITQQREHKKKQAQAIYRNEVLLDMFNRSFKSRQEQLDYTMHEALKLTKSRHGYIFLYDEKKQEFVLNSRSKGVEEKCRVDEEHNKYHQGEIGIWEDVLMQRKPMFINDFKEYIPHKRGFPKGHLEIKNYAAVPIIVDKKVVAVVGLANSPTGYDENDIYEVNLLMVGVWSDVERQNAQNKLSLERSKYLQTLISIGDGVMVVDKTGKVEMLNTVAQNITGWSLEEALGRDYKEIFIIGHENAEGSKNINNNRIIDPINEVIKTDKIQEMGDNVILTSKTGVKYYLEDSAAPIKNEAGETMGVVLVFRDISDKKAQREKIEYLSFHDSLTGLYNRRFFEEEMKRLDTERNLPISIIIGDVNGLKLTNDIYGHAFGDLLLQKVAQVMQSSCRADDIIARWGGDEFLLLLPKSTGKEAKKIIARINEEFANVQTNAIKGSISMGVATKETKQESITDVLAHAEERMYLAKALERESAKGNAVKSIINDLHESNSKEKGHSERVSELCGKVGRELMLSEDKICRLKEAGYLHNIGKIALAEKTEKQKSTLPPQVVRDLKKYSVVGYRILHFFDNTIDLAEAVLNHHEHWDGSGHPKGLKGEEIPLFARIISIAQSYDRCLEGQYMPKPVKAQDALAYIIERAGTEFDPQIVGIFVNMLKRELKKN